MNWSSGLIFHSWQLKPLKKEWLLLLLKWDFFCGLTTSTIYWPVGFVFSKVKHSVYLPYVLEFHVLFEAFINIINRVTSHFLKCANLDSKRSACMLSLILESSLWILRTSHAREKIGQDFFFLYSFVFYLKKPLFWTEYSVLQYLFGYCCVNKMLCKSSKSCEINMRTFNTWLKAPMIFRVSW